jgi:hypothetical protein
MEQAGYQIRIERNTNLISFRLSGFFDDAHLGPFIADRAEAFSAMKCGANRHVCIVDVSEALLQSQQMIERFRPLITSNATRSLRMAFVVKTSLARMQVRRLLQGRNDVIVVECYEEALAWLNQSGELRRDIVQLPGCWPGNRSS